MKPLQRSARRAAPAGLALLLVLTMAACGTTTSSDRGPGATIRSIERQGAPEQQDLVVEPSGPIDASPDMALENYRRLMELAPEGDTRAEAQRRMADLQVELDDIDPGASSEQRLREASELYQRLLRERPNDPGNDRVLYQLARAQQNLGDADASVATLAQLVERYPRSPYAADGRFRRAELLFGIQRFDEAVPEYEAVLALEDQTPFFEAAQYKYGWTLYRLARYEEALTTFFNILDRELPPGEPAEPESTLAEVPAASRDLVRDVIRVSSLSYINLGGGPAVEPSFQRLGQPRFFPLVYRALGEMLLDRERFTDGAEAFFAFVEAHPRHALAPDFQESVIGAYQEGGFEALVIAEKERYVDTYDPRAPYWGGNPAREAVLTALRTHLDDLSTYFHARAQEPVRDAEWPAARADYLTAASWYQRVLEVFPDAGDAPAVNYLLAETLYEGGEMLRAAEQYHRTAYDYATHERSDEAGYAAVLTYYEVAERTTPEARRDATQQAVDEALQFTDTFTAHPQRLAVLTRAAEDLYALERHEDAIAIASRVLNEAQVPANLTRTALTVRADAEFTLDRFAEAEASYIDLVQMVSSQSEEFQRVNDQLALSIFRQGEAQRDAGNTNAAVAQFLRIGKITPNASIRPSAEYDAAILLTREQDWSGAARVLEGFRTRFGDHELVPDADKQLANAYERSNQPTAAAGAYLRIAGRNTEDPAVREEAAWKAASLYDQGGDPSRAISAYENYVTSGVGNAQRRTEARERLIALTRTRDGERYRYWLGEAVAADPGPGAASDERTQLLAARASLALGEMAATEANSVRLRQPLRDSLQERRGRVERAAQKLERAAAYGFDEVTPKATHLLGDVYRQFAQAVLDSERPRGLDADAREEYNLLLEDQAFPIEEQAISLYEANLRRIPQGVWDEATRDSWRALTEMVPARYARNEILEPSYESLR